MRSPALPHLPSRNTAAALLVVNKSIEADMRLVIGKQSQYLEQLIETKPVMKKRRAEHIKLREQTSNTTNGQPMLFYKDLSDEQDERRREALATINDEIASISKRLAYLRRDVEDLKWLREVIWARR